MTVPSRRGPTLAATRLGGLAAVIGAPMFLVGTALHPARDGEGVAAAGEVYAITHGVQAIGLLLMCVALANLVWQRRSRDGGRWQ